MFDFITIKTRPLPDDKINHIVWRNCLQPNSENGVVYYDNRETKNLKQQNGIYICIETNRQLRMEGSLQKYFNEISGYGRTNHNMFSMADSQKAIKKLLFDKGIAMEDAYVGNYEIGLNLTVSKDCRTYLDKMRTICTSRNVYYDFYVNPKYVNPRHKNERLKITGFDKVRKYFKAYDKIAECMDRRRKIIPEGNILRIETVNLRLENCMAVDFFTPGNLIKLFEAFFRDWRTVRFERDIITPKGTGRAKRHLCIEIINKGKETVLAQAKKQHKDGFLSDWEYRNIREFIAKEWDAVKQSIAFVQGDEEREFRELLNVNYTILKHEKVW